MRSILVGWRRKKVAPALPKNLKKEGPPRGASQPLAVEAAYGSRSISDGGSFANGEIAATGLLVGSQFCKLGGSPEFAWRKGRDALRVPSGAFLSAQARVAAATHSSMGGPRRQNAGRLPSSPTIKPAGVSARGREASAPS